MISVVDFLTPINLYLYDVTITGLNFMTCSTYVLYLILFSVWIKSYFDIIRMRHKRLIHIKSKLRLSKFKHWLKSLSLPPFNFLDAVIYLESEIFHQNTFNKSRILFIGRSIFKLVSQKCVKWIDWVKILS